MALKATYTVTWNSSAGEAEIAGPTAPPELDTGDTVKVVFSMPGSVTVNRVGFFANKLVGGEDAKDTDAPRGVWTPNGSTGLTAYSVSDASGEVVIEDIEEPTVDKKYWFGVEGTLQMTTGTQEWHVDPELINKKKG